MTQSPWQPDNPEWMAKRKEEWRHVKANLDQMDILIPRRGHKYHKQYFFTGEVDQSVFNYAQRTREGIPDAFPKGTFRFCKFWYHPEPSLENFRELLDAEKESSSWDDLRYLLFNQFSGGNFSSDYGMLGGREELLVKLLFPRYDFKDKIEFGPDDFFSPSYKPVQMSSSCLGGTLCAIKGKGNPFSPGQYLWEHFLYSVEKYPERSFKALGTRRKLHRLCAMIIDYDNHEEVNRDNERGRPLRDKLLAQFESRELPEPLLAYYDEEKGKLGSE